MIVSVFLVVIILLCVWSVKMLLSSPHFVRLVRVNVFLVVKILLCVTHVKTPHFFLPSVRLAILIVCFVLTLLYVYFVGEIDNW